MKHACLALLAISACGPRIAPIAPEEIENPALLVETSELGSDFTARQTVEATFGERKAIFQAIAQKTGDRLVIVALTPQGQRVFTLEQRGREVSFEQYPGADLPFSPWHILVDIHRSIFRGGGPTLSPRPDGKHKVAHPLEPMVDTWKGNALVRRTIFAHGKNAAVDITYHPGAATALYQRSIHYTNSRVGYTLTITPL